MKIKKRPIEPVKKQIKKFKSLTQLNGKSVSDVISFLNPFSHISSAKIVVERNLPLLMVYKRFFRVMKQYI